MRGADGRREPHSARASEARARGCSEYDSSGANAASASCGQGRLANTGSRPRSTVPVLSRTTTIDAADGLEHARVADQDAAPRGGGHGGGDGERRGDAERAGAGDDQHRDGAHQAPRVNPCRPAPAGEGASGNRQHGGNEDARDAVHRALDAGPAGQAPVPPSGRSAPACCRRPTRVARISSTPPVLRLPQTTRSPAVLATRRGFAR